MTSYRRVCRALSLTAVAFAGCSRGGDAAPKPEDLAALSPEVFSHGDQASIADESCLGNTGVLITANSIGPVTVGAPLSALRQRCQIALVKVPASVAIQGPVLGVSVSGGLIIFTVSGKDSVVETVASSSPAFRTSNGIGVGTPVLGLSFRRGRLCFRHDSTRVTEVFISRHGITC